MFLFCFLLLCIVYSLTVKSAHPHGGFCASVIRKNGHTFPQIAGLQSFSNSAPQPHGVMSWWLELIVSAAVNMSGVPVTVDHSVCALCFFVLFFSQVQIPYTIQARVVVQLVKCMSCVHRA